jgi:hypothetical protein
VLAARGSSFNPTTKFKNQMSNETQPNQTPAATLAAVKAPEEFERLLNKQHLPVGVFDDPKEFQHAQRVGRMLVTSQLMPEHFRGEENLGSAVIVVDIAFRLRLNPLLVAQQIYLVHGKPGFSAQFMIAVCNTAADFGKIRYDLSTNGVKEFTYNYTVGFGQQKERKSATVKLEDRVCIAWAVEGDQKLPEGVNTLAKAKEKGLAILEGPPVSMEQAVREGWYGKSDSKWQTLPDLMLRYRAASFFVRLFAPELMMGLPTVDELEDMPAGEPTFSRPVFGRKTETPPPTPASPEPPPAAPAAKEPQVEPTPPEPAPTPPGAIQATPQATVENPISALRALCKLESIKEDQLIVFLKNIRSVKDNVDTFEEIHLADPNILGMICEQWEEIRKRVKENK